MILFRELLTNYYFMLTNVVKSRANYLESMYQIYWQRKNKRSSFNKIIKNEYINYYYMIKGNEEFTKIKGVSVQKKEKIN